MKRCNFLQERDELKGSASSAAAAAELRAAALEREIEELTSERGKSEAERIRCIYKTFGPFQTSEVSKNLDECLFRISFVAYF